MAWARSGLSSSLYFDEGLLVIEYLLILDFFGSQVSVRFMDSLNENSNSEEGSWLIFAINQKVSTIESYNPPFSLPTFIADLGGSLGLWLGVGVIQILGGAFKILLWAKKKK